MVIVTVSFVSDQSGVVVLEGESVVLATVVVMIPKMTLKRPIVIWLSWVSP